MYVHAQCSLHTAFSILDAQCLLHTAFMNLLPSVEGYQLRFSSVQMLPVQLTGQILLGLQPVKHSLMYAISLFVLLRRGFSVLKCTMCS